MVTLHLPGVTKATHTEGAALMSLNTWSTSWATVRRECRYDLCMAVTDAFITGGKIRALTQQWEIVSVSIASHSSLTISDMSCR